MYKLNYDFIDFQPTDRLTPEQVECYNARVVAYRPRFIWSESLKPLFDVCLVHSSCHVPGKVAYFSSVQNMLNNQTTRTSPEMFASRFLASAPPELRAAWEHEVMGKLLPEVKFIPNTEPQLWYQVYEEGPNSCMAGCHEVRQYANPKNDLALAYAQDNTGKITNRTIVNQKTKTYVRLYGNENMYFATALRNLGYTQSCDTLKNQRVWVNHADCNNCGDSVITGPYLDGDYVYVTLLPNTNGEEGIINDDDAGDRFRSPEEPICSDCND